MAGSLQLHYNKTPISVFPVNFVNILRTSFFDDNKDSDDGLRNNYVIFKVLTFPVKKVFHKVVCFKVCNAPAQ